VGINTKQEKNVAWTEPWGRLTFKGQKVKSRKGNGEGLDREEKRPGCNSKEANKKSFHGKTFHGNRAEQCNSTEDCCAGVWQENVACGN
jgi:hypothetical protein